MDLLKRYSGIRFAVPMRPWLRLQNERKRFEVYLHQEEQLVKRSVYSIDGGEPLNRAPETFHFLFHNF